MRRTALMVPMLVVLLLWPLNAGAYWIGLASAVAVYGLAALGLDLLYGYGGMLSLGHAAFFGIGAYTVAVGGRETDLTGWMLLIGATVAASAAAVVVGVISLRTTGYYFSLLTLAFALIIASVIKGVDWTGGPSGLGGISRDLVGTGQLTAASLYVITFVVLIIAIVGVRSIRRSRIGRALLTIRTDPELAAALGVNVFGVKLKAFVLGCALAGLAGGLFAQVLVYISPEFVGLTQSVQFLIMVVIGGMGTAWGALVGAVVVRGLPEAVQSLRDWQLLGLGLVTLLVLVRFRLGVVGTLEARRRRPDTSVPDPTPARETGKDVVAVGHAGTDSPRRPLLEVSGLCRQFGGLRALDGVDLVVHSGEIHALIGPNGAGKTTFINLVTGVDHPTAGEVRWKGDAITHLPSYRRARLGMARTFQLVALCPDLTIIENLVLGAYHRTKTGLLRGAVPLVPPAEEREVHVRASEILDRLGLGALAQRRPHEVPVGQRRLVEVGRALMAEAELILLDEPAAGLNETETNDLASLLVELRDAGSGILLVEHDMRLVMEISNTVTVLDFGVPLLTALPHEVAQDERVLSAYLGVVE